MGELIRWEAGKEITKANYKKAGEIARKIKTAQNDIEAKMKESVKAAHSLHKTIKSVMDNELELYKLREEEIKKELASFHKKFPDIKIDKVVFTDTLEPLIFDESVIPEEYMLKVPNMEKIKEAVKSMGKLFKCEGIAIKEVVQVRINGDKS